MWSITSKLNSTFGTIGNARADKMTWQNSEKSWGKNSSFRLKPKEFKIYTCLYTAKHICEGLNIFFAFM